METRNRPGPRGAIRRLTWLALSLSACGPVGADIDTVADWNPFSDLRPDLAVSADVGPAPPPPTPACDDGQDNDRDGQIDLADPGCDDTADTDESDGAVPACGNGRDDDADGLVDLADPGCASLGDPDEADGLAPACSDADDNDADGYTDFPADPGCGSDLDDDETNEASSATQCSDGEDNDRDGLFDLADPGCASSGDPREDDTPGDPPACSNGLDDDADGVVDFPLEPGCQAAGDTDETDSGSAQCSNGLDDDADGRVDYPDDPGCAGVGDRAEEDPLLPTACADGIDNDADGAVDYPDDTGCSSAADGSEAGSCGQAYQPAELEAGRDLSIDIARGSFLSEGSCGGRGASEIVVTHRVARTLERLRVRTDLEGTTAETTLYARRGCLDAGSEVGCAREPIEDGVAGNVLEVLQPAPGDYYIFVDGAAIRGGPVTLRIEEVPLAECLNGDDDDGDGRVDYPVDPGCERPEDRDETDPDPLPACADDVDNDGDGLVDYPLDVGCQAAVDNNEVDRCGQGVPVLEYPVGEPSVRGTLAAGATNQFRGTCGGANQPEKVFYYANEFNARLTISLDHEETEPNTLLYVRSECLGAEVDNGCSTGVGPNNRGRLRIDRAAPGDYFIFVDRTAGAAGPFQLSVDVERLPPGCLDGRDNDEDGAIDGEDLGCSGPEDEDERDPAPGSVFACSDGVDDDDDGAIDFPWDPGCIARGDDDESDPAVLPACANGVDDDADGFTDFPAEPGCQSRADDDEDNPAPQAQCSNRLDDDQDGITDYPNEPGCLGAGDRTEDDPAVDPRCANGADDDRDGLTDYPFDSGCEAASDEDETNPADPAERTICANQADDDADGVTDFPRDPGCLSAADQDEANGNARPQCANGNDDDGDGRVDFPDDPGCRFAADTTEVNQGAPQPRCSDGLDNDDDGFPDTSDVGCMDSRDNDETDPAPGEVPYCADGIDNDGDGEVDWPADDGCAAQGDLCEEPGFGLCDGRCQDLLANPLHCGRCGRACAADVECLDGRCGAIRPVVLSCGGSSRPVDEFIRGELVEAEVRVGVGCLPNDDTQAIVMARGGTDEISRNVGVIRPWLEQGGQLLTEWNTTTTIYNAVFQANIRQGDWNGNCQDNVQPAVQFSPADPFWQDNAFVPVPDEISRNVGVIRPWLEQGGQLLTEWNTTTTIYNAVFQANIGQGDWNGDCQDNVQPAVQFSPADPFWQDNAFVPVPDGVTGCGYAIPADQIPDFVPLGGWNAASVSLGYVDVDAGRLWLIEADWQDNEGVFTDESRDLMAYMIGGGRRAARRGAAPAACANRVDDDADGLTDFPEDPGCQAADDPDEAD